MKYKSNEYQQAMDTLAQGYHGVTNFSTDFFDYELESTEAGPGWGSAYSYITLNAHVDDFSMPWHVYSGVAPLREIQTRAEIYTDDFEMGRAHERSLGLTPADTQLFTFQADLEEFVIREKAKEASPAKPLPHEEIGG